MDQATLFEPDSLDAGATRPSGTPAGDPAPSTASWSSAALREGRHQQFRLRRIQVFNWGTFNQLHVFDVSESGHLLVGPSGSGKSTLLDGHAALLTPPKWAEFNVAARDSDRRGKDRSLLTYVRGAWAANESEEGQVVSQFLRPGTTWSAVAETYGNPQGQLVTLVGLWWIRGQSNQSKDVRDLWLVAERELSLKDLAFFVQSDFSVRSFATHQPDVAVFQQHAGFRERFKARLGIDHDLALRLLHRTQSAKNLGDLNAFMRENMLDEPQTFDIAKGLCEDFGTLASAHAEVVEARKQRDLLRQGARHYSDYVEARKSEDIATQLTNEAEPHRNWLRYKLQGERLDQLQVERSGLQAAFDAAEAYAKDEDRKLNSLMQERAQMSDADAAQLARRIDEHAGWLTRCQRDRRRLLELLKPFGWTEPVDARGFGERIGEARLFLEQNEVGSERGSEEEHSLAHSKRTAEEKLSEVLDEVRSLALRNSNLPQHMVRVRDQIAADLGLAPSLMPFAGELLQVKAVEQRWQGALERLLGGFARSFLVPEAHYRAVVDWLNAHHTGTQVLYLRMRSHDLRANEDADAPTRKLDVAAGEYGAWALEEARQQFGDVVCTDNPEVFRKAHRALSLQGQVKIGRTRHTKDDRKALNERREWVLGFSNLDKQHALQDDVRSLQAQILTATEGLKRLKDKRERLAGKLQAAYALTQMQWSDVDERKIAGDIELLRAQLQRAREEHPEIEQMDARIEVQKGVASGTRTASAEAGAALSSNIRTVSELEEERSRTPQESRRPPPHGEELQLLFERGTALTLDGLDQKLSHVIRGLNERAREARDAVNGHLGKLEELMRTFKRQHPIAAADMGTNLADWNEHAELLHKIEADNLPAFEKRFFDLLNEQSSNQLARLKAQLESERRAIQARMDLVNDALAGSHFNEGTFLRLTHSDRNLPQVKEFHAEVRECLSRSLRAESLEEGEARFEALHRIVKRLHGVEPVDREWRATVLDVRLHVDFLAKEYDTEGRVLDILRSGAGKSGGQRQKLAATVLAAALHYQLAGTDRPVPQFCTVVFDEAFAASDPAFTELMMKVFISFGFQLVLATPMKAVRTLEPFIGGAHVVTNKTRGASAAVSIEYDMTRRRLLGLEDGIAGGAETVDASQGPEAADLQLPSA